MSTNERANQLMGDCFGLTTFLGFEVMVIKYLGYEL